MTYDPDLVLKTQTSLRYSALARVDLDLAAIGTWDPDLLQESRVLVPCDVQALVVPPDGDDAVVVPGPLAPGATDDVSTLVGPEPLAAPVRRPTGVHLQWALPDGLLRGRLQDPTARAGGGLGLAALPDSWAVLRLVVAAKPQAAQQGPTHVRGWLVDAANGVVRDLAAGPASAPLPLPAARAVPRAELTGASGGSLAWTGAYDASFARFAWHDDLADLAADPELGGALPGGPAAASATYVVVGWWSDPELDPLDDVRTGGGLAERSNALGWRVVAGGGEEHTERQGRLERLADLGVAVASRVPTSVAKAALRANGLTRTAAVALGEENLALSATRASTVTAFQSVGALSLAKEAGRWVGGRGVGVEASTLLHGAVLSVPLPVVVADPAPLLATDLRPAREAVRVTLGEHVDDLVAGGVAGGAAGAGGLDPAARAATEKLLGAFTAGVLAQLSTPDGVADIDAREHSAGFAAVDPHEPPLVDRVLTGRAAAPDRPARPRAGDPNPSRLVFATVADRPYSVLLAEASGTTVARSAALVTPATTGRAVPQPSPARPAAPAPVPSRPGEQRVERPAPRRYVPLDPVVGVHGAGRWLRHGLDGRGDADERLACRRASQVVRGYAGLVEGRDLLASLASGAVPVETLALAREALLLSPHLLDTLTELAVARSVTAAGGRLDPRLVRRRVGSELVLRFDPAGGYLGGSATGLTLARGDADPLRAQTLELLRRHSLLEGVEPDVVALTSWAQPWVPLWLEWRAEVTPADGVDGWRLGGVDLEPGADGRPAERAPVVVSGRSPFTTSPGTALSGAIVSWLEAEATRDRLSQGEADPVTQAALAGLATAAANLDLLGCALDGVRTTLLGLPPTDARPKDGDGAAVPPSPTGLPELVAAGSLALTGLRLVDAFGRVLDLDPAAVDTPVRAALDGRPGVLARSPRFTAPTRCLTRFVDAAALDPAGAVDAVVDEVEPAQQVSPVLGFVLPDHVDESLEVFGADGTPLGEISVDARGGGVQWECAPGRPLPADAPPGAGLTPAQAGLGRIAAGMVAADARARAGGPADGPDAPKESALSAFLRAVDTTLWTVDAVAGAGSSGLASIVGRPVAVVRVVVELDVADDLDELTVTAAERDARALEYAALARVGVPVRIGELTRSDDGVLAFFVDDDYTRCHVVDRAVAGARASGRGQGYLGPWGTTPLLPAEDPLDHPYLALEDELVLHPGVPRVLTVLMLPGSALTVTSGVVPRLSVRLSRAWFADGLERISPSVRVGPVLVDPGEVRLPLVAALGERQVLTSRDGPLGWRDDAILAATQSALLPDRAASLREGWIRVDPRPAPTPGGAA